MELRYFICSTSILTSSWALRQGWSKSSLKLFNILFIIIICLLFLQVPFHLLILWTNCIPFVLMKCFLSCPLPPFPSIEGFLLTTATWYSRLVLFFFFACLLPSNTHTYSFKRLLQHQLTHNVELPIGFDELAGDLWILCTACDCLPVVLDGRHKAHLGSSGVHVDYFILGKRGDRSI